MDLVHFRTDVYEGREDTFYELQEANVNWGKLFLASGGVLKPSKCFVHLSSSNLGLMAPGTMRRMRKRRSSMG